MTSKFSPQENAREILAFHSTGGNANCLFDQLSRSDKMSTYRELNKIQDPGDSVPDLRLYMGQDGVRLYPEGQDPGASRCRDPIARKETAKPEARTVSEKPKLTEAQKLEQKQARDARERERVENPERPARNIEELADLALAGDQQSKLDLRYRLESLMNDRNPEYRKAVLNQMVEDGEYLAMNDAPHVKVETDNAGNPINITFSRKLGINSETIPLNKSVSEQVDEAQKKYINALGMVTGGLGKFDPDATM